MSQFLNLLGLLIPDAEAAGVSTIAKRLGVGLKEAQAIKDAARARKAIGTSDDNIRAVQAVRDAYQEKLPRLGSGLESIVYDAGDKVVKVPKREPGFYTNKLADIASPTLLDELGVPTKNINTSQNLYKYQDKINTPKVRPGNDPEFQKLQADQDSLFDTAQQFAKDNNLVVRDMDDVFNYMSPQQKSEYQNLDNLMKKRTSELWTQQGLNPESIANEINALPRVRRDKLLMEQRLNPNELADYPMDALAAMARVKAERKAKAFMPEDIHAGNVGLDDAGQVKIFDTGMFHSLEPENIRLDQFAKIKESIIASPEKKKRLEALMSPNSIKKAAAVTPLVVQPDSETSVQDSVLNMLSSGLNSPTAQGAIDLLSVPGSVGRSTIDSVTQGELPSVDKLKKAALLPNDPEQLKVSERITERVLPDASNVKKRTAFKTLLDFL